ncbi:MAG: PP2C family protein-serine/threonine phosphatase [Prosthecobacter sp.]|nr:PP2C family protein-serine/threonine phosphatase [Prosthecobacter sp.]
MSTVVIVVLSLLLVAAAVAFGLMTRKKNQAITQILEEEKAIVEEERRMFGFLHDLGEAISREDSHSAMYRLIVEGVQRVMESTGGALYLVEPSGKSLVPRHHSDKCVPLVQLPERIASMAKSNPASLLSFLRLHSIGIGDGLLGGIFESQKVEVIEDLRKDSRLGGFVSHFHHHATAMVGPLSFGPQQLGVLAVTASRDQRTYNANDYEVFKSLVEQSAFALANALAHQAAAEKKQIEAELRSASEIQRILLPERDPDLAGFAIAGKNIPAKVLSGDYYDYIPLPDGRLGTVIADVSGKGTAAAIITAMCRSVLRSTAPSNISPAAVLGSVNRLLFPDIREDMFISMIYLNLTPGSGSLTLARAGHTLPLLWRKNTGKVESLHSGGLAVGIDKGEVFERVTKDLTFTMEDGDCLLLYTDGVNEALDMKGLEYGEERIQTTLAALAPQGPQAVVDGLIADVEKFLGGRRSHDDITLIALQKKA